MLAATTTRSRLGKRLQAGSEVRRLADHRLLLRGSLADQVADHDEAGRDADPSCQRAGLWKAQPRDRGGGREAGADCPLGRVLVRLGPAEIGQHAVAHELGDVALEPGDLGSHGGLIGMDDLAQLLLVEAHGQRRRANEIDEHDGELPALGLRPRCWLGRLAQGGNGSQQALAVAERNAKRGQIGVGQIGHDIEIDLVRAKQLGVPVQAQPAQPRLDVQACGPCMPSTTACRRS